jgi:hypothetical protein
MLRTTLALHAFIGALLVLLPACGDEDTSVSPGTEGTETDSGPTSTNETTFTTTAMTTTGADDTTTDLDTTTSSGATTTDRDETTSTTGEATDASGTTGDETGEEYEVPACVDENLFDELPAIVQGTNLGFGNNHTGSCGGATSEDYVLAWQAPADGVYLFHTTDSDFDTVLYVRHADDGCAGDEISCNDDVSGATTSAMALQLDEGERVHVFVDAHGGGIAGSFSFMIDEPAALDCCTEHAEVGCELGDVTLCVCAADPYCCGTEWDAQCVVTAQYECGEACGVVLPAGETCYAAVNVSDETFPFQVVGAFDEEPALTQTCGDGTPSNAVWLSFTPVESGDYFISTQNFSATNAHSRLAVHETAACNPVGPQLSCQATDTKTVNAAVTLTAGTAYTIVFYTEAESSTMVDPTIFITRNAGNTCADPLPLENGVYSWQYATNTFVTADSEGCTGWSANGVDRAHEVTLAAGETLTVTLTPSANNPSIYLITDCADSANSCVAGADQNGSGQPETLVYTSAAGGTYYFIADRFFGTGPTTATYTLDVTIE